MSADDERQSIEPVLQLVFDGREGEAFTAISSEFGESNAEELRFSTTPVGAPGIKRDDKEKEREDRRNRVRLTNLYKLSVFLMDKECWEKAVTALGWTLKLSEDMDEPYFLEDSRFRKALCHKMMGQQIEMLQQKEMVSADKTFFIGDRILGVRDLD